MTKILLITPPFTQLNTPYPATPYLKGFLKLQGYDVFQADLGIELIHTIFSKEGFGRLFEAVEKSNKPLSDNSRLIVENGRFYLQTIGPVMRFLEYRDDTVARLLCTDHFLPRASRFEHLPDLDWSFGSSGVHDKARFLATRYIEDIGDLIKDAVTPYFGFSRYAERLAMSAHSFSALDHALRQPDNLIDSWLLSLLQEHLERTKPDVVGLSLPFPGNVFAGLKCGLYIRKNFPHTRILAGGGFVNTELRGLSDPAVFNCLDFVTLDDGERPFLNILKHLSGEIGEDRLKRTFFRTGNAVRYIDDEREADFPHAEAGCPDYSDLPLNKYLSLIEMANPMHRLWSDGRWNKLTVAHGCYWHKCSFCDTTLDYIKRFDSAPPSVLVDRIEQVMAQTGQTGFHFVDEAAPPPILREAALELLRRRLSISWWANIRFEQAFTEDLCRLLALSGCIAATGGLETASDRLLRLMDKGVTVQQAARVCRNFSNAGIMVHAYLMYGFPTQTARETIDSLEIVRQFFEQGLMQSAFWHRFTATAHSDVGRHPDKYKCTIADLPAGGFAKNDLVHKDPLGCDHERFSPGLNKALYNFMHGIGLDFPISDWFDFKVPAVSVKSNYVERAVHERPRADGSRLQAGLLWTENQPALIAGESAGKGKRSRLVFHTRTDSFYVAAAPEIGKWLGTMFERFTIENKQLMSLGELKEDYEKRFKASFDDFLGSREWKMMREKGLLLL